MAKIEQQLKEQSELRYKELEVTINQTISDNLKSFQLTILLEVAKMINKELTTQICLSNSISQAIFMIRILDVPIQPLTPT